MPSTLFYIASLTKAFTAAAASLLVDDNHTYPTFKWTTSLQKLIPSDFVLQDHYRTQHVTLEDALCHRTGLPGHDDSCGGSNEHTPGLWSAKCAICL